MRQRLDGIVEQASAGDEGEKQKVTEATLGKCVVAEIGARNERRRCKVITEERM